MVDSISNGCFLQTLQPLLLFDKVDEAAVCLCVCAVPGTHVFTPLPLSLSMHTSHSSLAPSRHLISAAVAVFLLTLPLRPCDSLMVSVDFPALVRVSSGNALVLILCSHGFHNTRSSIRQLLTSESAGDPSCA